MKIILLGGCNWLGRDLMNKLLSEKTNFHLTWVDNLSSEYSSRHLTWEFEYLKEDCYDFKYGDITNYSFLKSIMSEDSTIIYNIWREPDSIIGMEHITNLSKEYNSKLIYTTNDTLAQTFKKIIQKNNVNKSIGIQYTGEIIGNYDIYNKRDPIDTIDYYS
jgi:dTDP-D-glucose 4,6-dehydratase